MYPLSRYITGSATKLILRVITNVHLFAVTLWNIHTLLTGLDSRLSSSRPRPRLRYSKVVCTWS